MKGLKKLQDEITPKTVVAAIKDNHFLDLKQNIFFGKKSKLTIGQKAADFIAIFGGSWKFIILFFIFSLLKNSLFS